MRSSTSSFEPHISHPSDSADGRLPRGGWGRSWTLTIALCVGCLVGLEAMWRIRGVLPEITGDRDLWCLQRDLASRGDPGVIAVLGTSRANAGFDSELARRELPGRDVALLAISATHPMAALEDLADDPGFRGTVLCELFSFSLTPENWETQRPHVDYYHSSWRLERRFERSMTLLAQRHLVLAAIGIRLDIGLIPELVRRALIGPAPPRAAPGLAPRPDRPARRRDLDRLFGGRTRGVWRPRRRGIGIPPSATPGSSRVANGRTRSRGWKGRSDASRGRAAGSSWSTSRSPDRSRS